MELVTRQDVLYCDCVPRESETVVKTPLLILKESSQKL